MSGWSITIKGDGDVVSDAEHENLRALSRNMVRAAVVSGLNVTEATLDPVAEGGSGDVGVTDAEQIAEADKITKARTEKQAKEAEDALAESNKAQAAAQKEAAKAK